MADKTILELTNIGQLQSGDVLPIAREGVAADNGTTIGEINSFIKQQADEEPTENNQQLVKSGGIWSWVTGLINGVKEWANDIFFVKGTYSASSAVGLSDNLRGQLVDSEAYLIRPTGGAENEVANGVATVVGMEGNSWVWNQVALALNATNYLSVSPDYVKCENAGNNSIKVTSLSGDIALKLCGYQQTLDATHKYFLSIRILENTTGKDISLSYCYTNGYGTGVGVCGNVSDRTYSLIRSQISQSSSNLLFGIRLDNLAPADSYAIVSNPIVIDLTKMFGEGHEPATVAEFNALLGTKPYYAYNAGTILSAQTIGIKTYGQNLLNPTTRQAKLIPFTWEENSNVYTIKNVPSGATATFTPDATGVAETVDISGGSLDITSYGSGILELSAATADTYVCMKWDEQKDDDVVPYEDHTYNFDVTKVYGKVNGAGEYVQCFPNGMRSAGTAKDSLTVAGATKVIVAVDLGDLSWTKTSADGTYFMSNKISDLKTVTDGGKKINAICANYTCASWVEIAGDTKDKCFGAYNSTAIRIIDHAKDSLTGEGFATALSGVKLYYELATPITYTDLIYRDGGIDSPLSDDLMNITVNNWSIEEQLLTPYEEGNPTAVPATIKTQYGMDAVEAIDTLQKTSYFASDVRANMQALLTCINTNCAETLGGTFSVSDTATDKVFAFTFTPNTEPDVEPTNEGE